jgi:hypothetical protein
MAKSRSAFVDFVRHVVSGDAGEVSRRLAAGPSLATVWSDAGATRQDGSAFIFSEIAHKFPRHAHTPAAGTVHPPCYAPRNQPGFLELPSAVDNRTGR